jgi:hypothetical protein
MEKGKRRMTDQLVIDALKQASRHRKAPEGPLSTQIGKASIVVALSKNYWLNRDTAEYGRYW